MRLGAALLAPAIAALAMVASHRALAAPAATPAAKTAARSTAVVPLHERYREPAARLIGAALSSDHAWERLVELCDGIGNRLSGSAALDRAVEWGAASMRADGLERVRLQAVQIPHWQRGEERATMIAPVERPLVMLGLGRSVGTPPGGITADVVVVASYDQLHHLPADSVRGKIVLFDVPFTTYSETVLYRAGGATRAAAVGAVAVLVRSVGPNSLRTPHTGAMYAYVDSFPKIPGAAIAIEDAAMIHRMLDRGKRVRVRLEMGARTLPDVTSHNVIGEIRGRERPNEVVVVGGHLDSWDVGQGAHDDGGGVAISMEALRLIKSLGLRPRRTLRCVLFTNEENGSKGGHAYDSLAAPGERHVAAVESDGGVERPLGFGVQAFKFATDTTDTARTLLAVKSLARLAPLLEGLGAANVNDEGGGTDIEELMKDGVPGIAHRTVMEHYFEWHHTQADMLDKVDPIELRRNVAALAVLVYVLADMPDTLLPPIDSRTTARASGAR